MNHIDPKEFLCRIWDWISWDLSRLKVSTKSVEDVSVGVNYSTDGVGHIVYTDGKFIKKAGNMSHEYTDSHFSGEDAQLRVR